MNDPGRTQMLSADPNRTQMGTAPSLDPNKTMMGTAPSLNATQTIKPVQCPVCKTFNPAGMICCVECGLIFEMSLDGDAFGAPAVQLPVLVDQSGREYPIRPGQNTIGREGDIQINEPKASRRHAQVTLDGETLTIEDLGSTNGTTLNGTKLSQGSAQPLNAGDSINIAGFEMKLSMPGATNKTAVVSANKTAAISAAPRVEQPPAFLVGESIEAPLKSGINTFGRKSDNDVQIADGYISGKHGLIELADDGIYITDTGSTNGTMLSGAKLSPNMRTKMSEDDEIQIGALVFRVKVSEVAE
ncbi:MAG: FHA domain-containing protein [Fimbriimonadaceae bacterium]|nr:FHA domain-containing protein [Fimbriimonadaceae bacterium]